MLRRLHAVNVAVHSTEVFLDVVMYACTFVVICWYVKETLFNFSVEEHILSDAIAKDREKDESMFSVQPN